MVSLSYCVTLSFSEVPVMEKTIQQGGIHIGVAFYFYLYDVVN
jgi:hypothetical protein